MISKTTETKRGESRRPESDQIEEREEQNWNGRNDYRNKDFNVNIVEEEKEGRVDVSQDASMNERTAMAQELSRSNEWGEKS